MTRILLPTEENPFPGIVFVDCEASALERPSYPIEVGLAWCDGRSEGHLVRPAPEWEGWVWSPLSAGIHGIPHDDLIRHGKELGWIAEWLNRELEGRIVCSDNPGYEVYWLGELFDAAGVEPRFAFHDSRDLVCAALVKSGVGLEGYEPLERRILADFPITHRAAEDALFWAIFFREANRGTSG